MKQTAMVHKAVLSLLLIATAGSGYAQHEGDRGGQDKQDRHAQPSGDQHGQQHAQQNQQQDRGQQQQGRAQQQNARQAAPVQREQPQRAQGQQRAQPQQRMQQSQQRNDWQQHRANNFESQHQSWAQRGGYRGDRIPDASFRQRFGGQHSFRVYGLPYMEVGGRSRFQYGGYWFSMMDPYPEYWGANWYRDDDMYVDYNDGGYYLYDRRFPSRPGLAISISF
jgi:hypothetical protein